MAWTADSIGDQTGKIAVVTGASSGSSLEAVERISDAVSTPLVVGFGILRLAVFTALGLAGRRHLGELGALGIEVGLRLLQPGPFLGVVACCIGLGVRAATTGDDTKREQQDRDQSEESPSAGHPLPPSSGRESCLRACEHGSLAHPPGALNLPAGLSSLPSDGFGDPAEGSLNAQLSRAFVLSAFLDMPNPLPNNHLS